MTTSVGVIVLVSVLSGLAIHRLFLSRCLNNIAPLRVAADEALWRRYNVVGEMIPWAANEGDETTESLFKTVVAAREAVMTYRANRPARLAAEDRFQAALNAFYRAAYRDQGLLSVHEWVVAAALVLTADIGADTAVRAHDTAATNLIAHSPCWLMALYGLELPEPFRLTVPYRHPSLGDQPLA